MLILFNSVDVDCLVSKFLIQLATILVAISWHWHCWKKLESTTYLISLHRICSWHFNRAPDKLRICVFCAMKTSKNACIISSECTHYAYILLCKQTFQIRSVLVQSCTKLCIFVFEKFHVITSLYTFRRRERIHPRGTECLPFKHRCQKRSDWMLMINHPITVNITNKCGLRNK